MKRNYFIIVFLFIFFLAGSAWAESITICAYGGTYNTGIEDIFGKPFTEATGIEVIVTTRPIYSKMKVQVKSGNVEWDIVDAESRMYARGVKDGIFEELDLSMIDVDDFQEGAATKYGVAGIYYSYNITYSTEKWPGDTGPKNMKDYWNVKKFPGPRGMKLTAFSNLEAASMAAGIPVDKVYPIDVKLALKKMTELKPHIRTFWKTGAHGQQLMRDREVDLCYTSGGRIYQMMDQGFPVNVIWQDSMIILDYWTILKGSKHKEAAMKWIAFASDPKRQAAFAEWTNYGASSKKAYQYISKEKAVRMPTYPENYKKGVLCDADWYAENEKEIERAWEIWKLE
jgi:putative spermidine/putrescine transport system substrate-binding protein